MRGPQCTKIPNDDHKYLRQGRKPAGSAAVLKGEITTMMRSSYLHVASQPQLASLVMRHLEPS
jgi:hypothetical protein